MNTKIFEFEQKYLNSSKNLLMSIEAIVLE